MRSDPMKPHSFPGHHFAASFSWVFSLESVVLHKSLWDVSSKSVGHQMIQVWIHLTWAGADMPLSDEVERLRGLIHSAVSCSLAERD